MNNNDTIYNSYPPKVSTDFDTVEATTATPIVSTPIPEEPMQTVRAQAATPKPAAVKTTSASNQPRSSRGWKLLPFLFILLLSLAVAYITYTNLPNDYFSCARFPRSILRNGECQTFYGRVFPVYDLEQANALAVDPTPTIVHETVEATEPAQLAEVAGISTKGGIEPTVVPSPTAAPTLMPTPSPTVQAEEVEGEFSLPKDWTKHYYAAQGLTIYAPKNWTGSNATHNLDTKKTTFTLGQLSATIYPNWDELGQFQNKAAGMTTQKGTGVIVSGNDYVIASANQVYHFNCSADKDTCARVLYNSSL